MTYIIGKETLMSKKRNYIVLISVIFLTLIIIRVVYINNKYPNPVVKKYDSSQSVIINGYEIKIESKKMYKMDQLPNEIKNNLYRDFPELKQDFRICLLKVNFKNIGQSEKKFQVYNLYLQSKAWANGIDSEMFHMFNQDTELEISCKQNDDVSLLLPYAISKQAFNEKDWNMIDKRYFDLILSVYPKKVLIHT